LEAIKNPNKTIIGNITNEIGSKADILHVLKNNMLTAKTQEAELELAA